MAVNYTTGRQGVINHIPVTETKDKLTNTDYKRENLITIQPHLWSKPPQPLANLPPWTQTWLSTTLTESQSYKWRFTLKWNESHDHTEDPQTWSKDDTSNSSPLIGERVDWTESLKIMKGSRDTLFCVKILEYLFLKAQFHYHRAIHPSSWQDRESLISF